MSTIDKQTITADMILDTAKRLGVRLERGWFFQDNGPDCCTVCAAGTLALLCDPTHGADVEDGGAWAIADITGLSLTEVWDLSDGFEGHDPVLGTDRHLYEVGRAVARAAGLPVPELTEATP